MPYMKRTGLQFIGSTALVAALIAPSAALANTEPQGLYSGESLLGSTVYTQDQHKDVGEIDDIVFDNQMSIQSFVVETDNKLGLSGKSYVVKTNQVRVKTNSSEQATDPDYDVLIGLTATQLEKQPVYSNSWWNKSQQQAEKAWQKTKQSADSAWTNVKQGSKSLYQSAKNAVHSAAESAADATNN